MRRRHFLSATGASLVAGMASTRQRDQSHGESSQRPSFRIIDAHIHVFNSDLKGTMEFPPCTIEHTLRLMDEAGVEKGFLISYNAEDVATEIRHAGGSPLDVQEVFNNQYQFKAWQRHKDRFWWIPDSISPVREGYMADLERNLDHGASGIKLLLPFHGLLPDHRSWRPVYELCRKLKKPILWEDLYFLNRRNPETYPVHNETRARRQLAESIKSFGEYARSILDPIFSEFSEVPISLVHVGVANAPADYGEIFELINRHPNVSCDVSSILEYDASFIERLVKAVGARKIMYGSDSPWGRDFRRRWGVIADLDSLSHGQRQLILADNAERFVRFEIP